MVSIETMMLTRRKELINKTEVPRARSLLSTRLISLQKIRIYDTRNDNDV